jgi:CRP-like cAMP-binding protein
VSLTIDQKQELLQEHFLLRHLSPDDLKKLAARAEMREFAAEETIFSRGDIANHMMVVTRGKVQISSPAAEGDDIIFATMHPGDVFGEMALLDGHERSTNALATEPTEVLTLQRDDFIKTLENNPKLCIDLLRVLCTRLRHTNELLEDFTIIDLRRRLAKRLAYLNQTHAGPAGLKMSVRVSADELIAMIGVSEDAIRKQLLLWDQQGIIRLDGGWVSVQDLAALNGIVAEDF